MLSEKLFSSNEPSLRHVFLCLSRYKRWPRTVPRTWMSSGSQCPVGPPEFRRLEEHPPATCRCTRVLPARVGSLRQPQGKLSAQRVPPEVSPPAQPCQPWGHAPPGSTKQLQCRRGSGSPAYGRSTYWAPSQRTGADRRGCVHPRTSEYLFCPLSPAPASRLPVSSSSRENTAAEAKDSWAPVRLLLLTHCLALLSHLTSLSLAPSLEKDKAAGFAWVGRLSPGKKPKAISESSPWGSQPRAGDRAKCKGQSRPVTRGVLLLIFNLGEPFSWDPAVQIPAAAIMYCTPSCSLSFCPNQRNRGLPLLTNSVVPSV